MVKIDLILKKIEIQFYFVTVFRNQEGIGTKFIRQNILIFLRYYHPLYLREVFLKHPVYLEHICHIIFSQETFLQSYCRFSCRQVNFVPKYLK